MEILHETKQIKVKEKHYCQEHFLCTHFRKEDGRYVVERAVMTDEVTCLGETREKANKRSNLKRFAHN